MVKQKTPSTSGQEMVKGEKEGIPPTSGSQGSRAVYVVVLLGVGVAVAGVVLRALDLSRENIQLVAAAKLEKEGLGEEMRVLREDLVQEQSVNSLIKEENSEQVKVLEEQEARLVGLEQELGRSKEREAGLTLAKNKCGEREREVEKSHKETIGGLNKEMKTQAKDFIKQKKQKDQLLKLNVEKETEIEQLKGWLDREMETQAEDIKKQKTLNDQLLHKLKGAFEKASKEKAELLEAAKVEKEGITTEKQEEVRSILNIVAEKEAEISASKTAFLQKSEELVVLNASNQELRSALDTFKTQMEAQTKAVEAEKSTASKVSEELRAEQEVRQSAEAQVASLVEEKSSLEAGVLQAQGDVGLCLADRAREVREATEARDSLQVRLSTSQGWHINYWPQSITIPKILLKSGVSIF